MVQYFKNPTKIQRNLNTSSPIKCIYCSNSLALSAKTNPIFACLILQEQHCSVKSGFTGVPAASPGTSALGCNSRGQESTRGIKQFLPK